MSRWHASLALLLLALAMPAQASERLVALLEPAGLPADDAYLRAAEQHYRGDPTVLALTRVASLAALHRWLVRQAEAHGPAAEIVLVGHGSAWTGVAIDLHANGPRATASVMQQARASGAFPPLPAGVIGAATRWRIDSCAAGRQQAWLQAFAALWQEQAPVELSAAADFVVYEQSLDEHGRLHSRRYDSPIRIDIFATPGPAAAVQQTLHDPVECAPLAAPCEQRRLPIWVEYRQMGDDGSQRRPRRLPRDAALTAALADINLRPGQLRWRPQAEDNGTILWVGQATAELHIPAATGWQAPDISLAGAAR